MATTIHVPKELLVRVDSRARALRVSRNRWILSALEAGLGTHDRWPPELVRILEQPLESGTASEFSESMRIVRARRRNRRKPPEL